MQSNVVIAGVARMVASDDTKMLRDNRWSVLRVQLHQMPAAALLASSQRCHVTATVARVSSVLSCHDVKSEQLL